MSSPKRKKKDPAAPKRALSAFMFFSSEARPKVLADNPGIAFGQVGKKLGEQWRAMTEADKAKYQAMSDNDKLRYEREMATYVPNPNWDGGKKKKRKKDPNAPKRPLSGFMFFSNEKREFVLKENPGIEFKDVGRKLGEMWRAATDADKQPYHDKNVADKARYEREMASYVPSAQ